MAAGAGADERHRPELIGPAGPSDDTIFALSSGALPAAIGVVRVSGPTAERALHTLAGRVPPSRRASVASLSGPDGQLLDRAMILWMPGPNTATGEDLAELHLHGGKATVAAVLRILAGIAGLRAAEPGEFTRRALLNGRMDLSQVEGLADLLVAESEGQRRAALRLAEGGLGRLVAGWQDRLLQLSAQIEAELEFAEEHDDVGTALVGTQTHAIRRLADDIGSKAAAPPAERLRDGVRIVIAGPVNAGKSTLLNALAGREAAITSPVEGTTRDLIEVPVMVRGLPCVLVDSAGLRDTHDPVEQIGIARAEQALADADLLLWLGPAEAVPTGVRAVAIQAQADLPGRAVLRPGAELAVSAVTGDGMERLVDHLVREAAALLPLENSLALHERHRTVLNATATILADAAGESDALLRAEQLRAARTTLGTITGATGTETMLNALFERFCIGK